MSLSRGKQGFVVLVIVAIVAGGTAFYFQRSRAPVAAIPSFDTSGAFPQVAEAIEAGISQVRKDPRSGRAWGHLGMLAMAHNYREQAVQCFAEAARLVPSQSRWVYYLAILEEVTDLPAASRTTKRRFDCLPNRLRCARGWRVS